MTAYPDPFARKPLPGGPAVPPPLAELAALNAHAQHIHEAAQECICGGTREIHVHDGRIRALGDYQHNVGCPFDTID